MKKTITLFLMILIALSLVAQTPKAEAMQSLDSAKALLSKDDYAKAQDEINYALAKISEILAEKLEAFIPENPAGFTFESKEAQSLGQAGAIIGSANSINATGSYTKGDASLNINISVGGVMGQSAGLMGLASMFGGTVSGNTTVRIAGYTGTIDYDKSNKSGTLTIKVGNKITVMVTGEYIPNADLLKTLAESIDLSKLEKSF